MEIMESHTDFTNIGEYPKKDQRTHTGVGMAKRLSE